MVFLARLQADPGWRVLLAHKSEPGPVKRAEVSFWGIKNTYTGGVSDMFSMLSGGLGVEFVALGADGQVIEEEGHLIVGRFGPDISDDDALEKMFNMGLLRRPTK